MASPEIKETLEIRCDSGRAPGGSSARKRRKEAIMRPPLFTSVRSVVVALVFTAAATTAYAAENIWTPRGPDEIAWVTDTTIAEGKAYVGTLNGVFRSEDDGASWQSIGLAGHLIDQIGAGGGSIYARTNGELHVSKDGGQNWNRVLYPITVFAVDPVDPSTVYVSLTDGVLVRSSDGGSTFQVLSRQLQDRYPYLMAVDSHGIYVVTYEALFRSADGGVSWTAA